jgi:6-phosphogluconolactonase
MTTKVVPGQLVAARDAGEVAREAASRIARALQYALSRSPTAAVALSGGNTPRDAYALLAHEPDIDWSRVDVFWVDERAVPPTDDRSNFRWAKATLLDAAGLSPARVHRMPADAPDGDLAARDYERIIRACVEADADAIPAFDLVVLGIGEDGHTASLFPGEPTVDVVDRLVVAVPARGAREARMTLTAPAIEHARSVLIIAVGAGKRTALERVWSIQGDLRQTPARVIRQCHGGVTWIIDKAAGGVTED